MSNSSYIFWVVLFCFTFPRVFCVRGREGKGIKTLYAPLIGVVLTAFFLTSGLTFAKEKNEERQFFGAILKKTASRDPMGWREFKWGMTKEETKRLGAQSFQDSKGVERFGLKAVELLPGKWFWVDLGFYSHIHLASILVQMEVQGACQSDEYETLLKNLRERHGPEKESKNLEYPNAWFQSHVWAVGFTRIALRHSCNKAGSSVSSNQSFLTSINYEKRRTIEPWNL